MKEYDGALLAITYANMHNRTRVQLFTLSIVEYKRKKACERRERLRKLYCFFFIISEMLTNLFSKRCFSKLNIRLKR